MMVFKKKSTKSLSQLPAFEYALYLLSLRQQTSVQLADKLDKKGYAQADIKAAVQRLTSLGYLNDQQFAQIYFENLKKYKTFGYFGIKKKLMDKKLDKSIIDSLLESLDLNEEQKIAGRLLAKQNNKTRIQKARTLQNKGFRSDIIVKMLNA